MLISNKETILCALLKCGTNDLYILENINYDIEDIVKELNENGCLSFNDIFATVFRIGANDLNRVLNDNKNYIIERIKKRIDNFVLAQEELNELYADLELIKNDELRPIEDLTYYCNCQDTYVYMKHLDFYEKYLKEDLKEIENNMGMCFSFIN